MRRVLSSEPVARGCTPARRTIERYDDGTSAFRKEATDESTAAWLREEKRIYDVLNEDFLPRFLGWREDPPTMWLEDLSSAAWPPPWDRARVEAVLSVLKRLHSLDPPRGIKSLTAMRSELQGWRKVAENPEPFLRLGLCTESWLRSALPVLQRAESEAELDGSSLLHLDIRSDNLCFADRVVLVDWNWASVGNPEFDLAFWLPSLEVEGGARPDEILPEAPELAAVVSGFLAAHAGRPDIPTAPRVREIQRTQLRTALPWAARALGLAR